jgi:predicted TIM-barrel fold metal-dependent hydrolase
MFASNFPVSKMKISFNDLYKSYKQIVKNFSDDEKKWLFSKTAMKVYDIKV